VTLWAVRVWRLAFGVLTLVAVGVQFRTGQTHPPFDAVNFFSYFTILSNILGAVVFVLLAVLGSRLPHADLLRGAAALYLTITFLVYALLLSGVGLGIVLAWVNNVVHRIFPIVVLLDWFLVRSSARLNQRQTWWWLAFPVLYLVYSLIRGAVTGWYPYPFLDPRRDGGYLGVTVTCLAIAVAFALLTMGLTRAANARHR
jgi:hypothetical protein